MTIYKSNDSTEIIVRPNRPLKNVLIFVPAGAIVAMMLTLTLFKLLISIFKNQFIFSWEIFAALICYFIFILYPIWIVFGKEKIAFKDNFIFYTKTNGILKSKFKFDLKFIKILLLLKKYTILNLFLLEILKE